MKDETREIIRTVEVQVIEPDIVEQIRALCRLGWGAKRVARELGLARNTVRKYRDPNQLVGVQKRPEARGLSPEQIAQAKELFTTTAEHNAAVVHQLLDCPDVSLRTVQRYVEPIRTSLKSEDCASVRFETPPGQQIQIDFGERRVNLGGTYVLVYFFVATLSYSRRTFVRASLSQRQAEWMQGLEEAILHFGGRPEVVLVDNARALIIEHTQERVVVNPVFQQFCADRELTVMACRPYRPRTKGKVENGVKYVKRNAIAGRSFSGILELQEHLKSWMSQADSRIHGTTHRRPIDMFHEAEAKALRPLHNLRIGIPSKKLRRKVANDCHFDLDTTRYSVPHQLTHHTVEVETCADEIVAWFRGLEVARHRRGEPHERITDPAHFRGLHRSIPVKEPPTIEKSCLAQYAAIIGGML